MFNILYVFDQTTHTVLVNRQYYDM